jgi:hypothetical protein
MKNLIINSFGQIKKNKQIWILSSLVYSLIMTIGMSISYILGFMNLLVILFIAIPFALSFITISNKCYHNENIEYKDIYSGYRELSFNLSFIIKRLIFPTLILLVIYFAIYLGLSTLNLLFFNFNVIKEMMVMVSQGVNQIDLTLYLLNNEALTKDLLVCNYISMGITFILINLFLNKKIMTINFYNKVRNIRINYDFIISNKKQLKKYKLFLFNLLCSLFIVMAFILSLLSYYLVNKVVLNPLLAYLLANFIFYFVLSIGIPIKYNAYSYIFNENFTEEVEKLNMMNQI